MRTVESIENAVTASGDPVRVTIADGLIVGVDGKTTASPASRRGALDAQGLALCPGWIDLQINGAFGRDFTEEPESVWDVAAALLDRGVTSFLPTLVSAPTEAYERALAILREGPPDAAPRARALGLHLEGPFLASEKKGAHDARHLLSPNDLARGLLPPWLADPLVRMVTLAPELPEALPLVRLLAERGKVVSAGHSNADLGAAVAAFDAGVTAGTHLFNAMSGLHHRHPGLAAAILTDPRVTAGVIADGVHVHPTMLRLACAHLRPDRLVLVSDAMAAAGMGPGRHTLAGRSVIVDEDSARLEDGTLAGCPFLLDDLLRRVRKLLPEIPRRDVVAAVTANPARLLGLRQGRIEPGRPADLVLVDENGRAEYVLLGGRICKEPE